MEQLTFIDFFAGIGGFRRGMELAGHKCVGFCEFDKFATASYTSMHLITLEQREYLSTLPLRQRQKEILKEEYRNGEWYANDIRTIHADAIPPAKCWCFGSPCFTAGTLITTHRGLVPIEEIQAGDLVLTHNNRFQRVITPMINVKRGIYTLKVQGSPKTEVTGNHRFFVRDKTQKWNNEIRRYETIISEPYWKEVQNFNGNELIQFTVNHEENNIYDLTAEECWLIGRYIADGYLRNDERKDRPSKNQKVVFCIGKHKKEAFESHCQEMNMYLSEERTVIKYTTSNKKLFALCLQCGRGAENKKIPNFIMDLHPNMLKIFLDGYLSGDGSYSDGVWKATSVSKKLIYQLGQCVMKAYGVGYSIYFTKRPEESVIEGRTIHQKDTWQINFRIEGQKSLAHYIDGSIWMPIKEIEYNGKRQELVYNMEVENDNSYTANNMGVHNCQSFSLAGKRAGLEGESGLIREIFRLLDELKEEDRPEWLIYENVKGMFSSNKGWDYAAILAEMDRLGYDIQWQNINSKWFVPQNRERVYTVGHLRRFGPREVFPIERTGGENSVCQLGQLYGTEKESNPSGGRVYDPSGISPTTGAGHGMSQPQIGLPCFFDMNYGAGLKLTSEARTLQSRYNKGVCNHAGETSGVVIQIIGEVNSSQDGQVHDISGISKCHSAGHSNSPKVAIPVGGCYRGTSPDFSRGIYEGSSRTLKADSTNCVALGIIDRQGRTGKTVAPKDHCPTLRSQTHGNVPEVVMPVMNPDRVNKKQNGRRIKENGEPMFTLTAQDRHGVGVQVDTPTKRDRGIFVEMAEGYTVYAVWYEKYQCYIAIRKLTPKECFRLQGWSDDYFEKAAFVNSDSQLYKQAGNGVTVPVVQAVAEKLI